MNFSNERLTELLLSAHQKIKNLKSTMNQLRKQINNLRFKLEKIEEILIRTDYYFDKYDKPSNKEIYELTGKIELKEELLKIIESK